MNKELVEIIQYYAEGLKDIYVDPKIFLEFTTILIIAFIVRWIMLYCIETGKTKCNTNKTKKNKMYIRFYLWEHCGLELLIAYTICYFFIKLTYADPTSYIINMIISPAIGFVCGVLVDNKFIIPIENMSGLGKIVLNKMTENKDKKDNSEIVININNGCTNDNYNPPAMNVNSTVSSSICSYLDKSISDDDNFNEKIIDTINDMKKEQMIQHDKIESIKLEQSEQSKKIDDNMICLQTTIEDLRILKESEMINKKIELKRLIYNCLNQGYATPEQYDKISLYYESYKNLGGNHEVESLYNDHFIKLDIHDDRRHYNGQIVNNIQQQLIPANTMMIQEIYGLEDKIDPNKRIYTYGEFDNIVEDK